MFPDNVAREFVGILTGFAEAQRYVRVNIHALYSLQQSASFLLETVVDKHVSMGDCQRCMM